MSNRRKTLSLILVVLTALTGWLYAPDKTVAELAPAYLRAPTDFIDVAGIRLHVRDDGPRSAPALLLLHGFGSSLQTWEPWARRLAGHYRVIRLDLPGFGLTGPDPTGDYSDARALEILAALLDRLSVQRVTPIGNSFGGRLAWKFAAAHPERVDKLVLISPDGFASTGFEYGQAPKVPWVLRLMRYSLPTFMVRASLAPAYADASNLPDERVARYRDMMLATGVRGAILARLAQTVLVPPEPILATIRAPTLLLWGELDRMIPLRNAQDYLKSIPNARLVSLPDLGHVPQEEAPERSLVPLLQFLQ